MLKMQYPIINEILEASDLVLSFGKQDVYGLSFHKA